MDLSSAEVKQLNDFSGFLSFKFTWAFKKFINCPEKIILLIYGNQGGKTGGTAFSYVLRILGYHPVAKKNVLYYECQNGHAVAPLHLPSDMKCTECGEELKENKRGSRVFRFCAETLPGQSANVSADGVSAEVKNTQYPEFKKWCPQFLIKKDITARNPAMIVKDPYGGQDIVIEFISYNQSVQSTAGTQRLSIWFDESPSFAFYEEQLPRLIAEDGDMVFTYTPVDRSSWLFDEFFEKAAVYYRSKSICKYLNELNNTDIGEVEKTENPYSIAIIQAATDDNPTLKKEVIQSMFSHIDDPDVISIRRYGIFKQLSGKIFKDFDYSVHVLKKDEYFPDGVPHDWVHARGIDFHPQTPWACGMISLSPTNEAFIWGDYNPSPEKYTIREIARQFALLGRDYQFRISLIDPLSEATKKDFITVRDDLNREFYGLRREGIGTGGEWITWDTKGEKGRDSIRERLKNAKFCKRPFNNRTVKNGVTVYLPTIWILNNCKSSIDAMKNWRWEEWADIKANTTKDAKNSPEQKWSHFNMVWEAVFKHPAFRHNNSNFSDRSYSYFKKGM